ncbi:MAG: GNAT family N-acetyltransferase [Thermodesulfobacteriota bacterium]|nr:GNAT family N-acetyltransferase [Thermodesulfobacteriota bacterium]
MELVYYSDNDYQGLKELLEEAELFVDYLDKREILNRKTEHDPESIIIAKEDDEIVGSIFFVYDPWMSSIFRLCVRPEYRSQGIGSALMDKAEEILKDRGVETVGIYVEKDNESIEFYSCRGYDPFGDYGAMEKRLITE